MAEFKFNAEGAKEQVRLMAKEVRFLKKETANMGEPGAKSLQILSTGLKNVNRINQQTIGTFDKLNKELKETQGEVKRLSKDVDKLTKENAQLDKSLKKTQATTKKTGTGFQSLGKKLRTLVGLFGLIAGIQIFANLLKPTFDLIKTFDSLEFSMKKINKTASDLRENKRFLIEITRAYGVEIVATTNRYIKFLAAAQQSNLSLKDTQKIFRSMTKASAVLGLKTDELRGIYLALEQMLSKGKITTEELRRQLGERLPGAMGIMAMSMGVTISQLDKMMKKGEVLSAEVLPDFADAVELAFGIQTVKTVDTLISAQIRLSNSWKQFIQDITEGDSAIKVALKASLDLMAEWVEGLQLIFNNASYVRRENMLEYADFLEWQLEEEAKFRIKQRSGIEDEEKDLIDASNAWVLKVSKAKTEEEINIANQGYADSLKALQDYYKAVDKEATAYAKEEFPDIVDKFEKQQEKVEKLMKDIEAEIETPSTKGTLYGLEETDLGVLDMMNEKLRKAQIEMDKVTKKYDIYRKQLLKSGKIVKPEDIAGKRQPRAILDLTNKIRAEELKAQIQHNKILLKEEEISLTTRQAIMERNLDKEKEINKLSYEDKVASINAKAAREKKMAVGNNTRIEKLETERLQKIFLAEQDFTKKKINLEEKTADEIKQIRATDLNRWKEEANDKKAELKAQMNEEIEIAKRTSKSRAEFAEEEARITLKYKELERLAMIKILENMLKYADVLKLNTKEIKKLLKDLKSQSFDDPFIDIEKQKDDFKELLETIGAFNDEIANLGNAIFDRKIENIEAEIRAEEDKFDKLIALNKNNASNVEVLEKQKADRIAALEKKKLKEQQKQAKFNKASALVDIAINTAIGISAATSTGPLGLWAIPIIAALGALQVATVLAQPIPQYKEGLARADKDHLGMINDGRSQEYIERDGSILTTKTKNAIVGLKKDDTVHKDYNTMVRKSLLVSVMNNGDSVNEFDFNRLYDGITDSMTKGISKARLNASIKLNQNNNNEYRDSLTRWN